MARKIKGAAKSTAGVAGKVAKGAAGAVVKGAQKIGQAVKGPAPIKPKDGETVMTAGMYESLMEAELAPSDVTGIIQHFVKKGLQAKGADVKRSKYAAPAQQEPAGIVQKAQSATGGTAPTSKAPSGEEPENKLVSAPKGVDQGPNSKAAGGTGEDPAQQPKLSKAGQVVVSAFKKLPAAEKQTVLGMLSS